MTSRNKRRPMKVPIVIPFNDIIESPLFHSVMVESTIRLEQDGESKVFMDLPVASDETNKQKTQNLDALRSEWFGISLKMAIQTAGAKYATSVKKIYQHILDDFHTFSATEKFCRSCHSKQLPPVVVGDLVIPCSIRIWYFIVDENTIAYTIRSPGDKENKRTAARNISNIMKIADTIKLNTTKERIEKSQRKIKMIDGKKFVTKPLGGIIVRHDGVTMLNTLLIKV